MGKPKINKNFLNRDLPVLILSTLFGVGYVPALAGTAGSVVGVIFLFFFKSDLSFFVFTLLVLFISFPLSTRSEKIFGEKDCKKIVIDDFAGMLISLIFLPKTTGFVISAFILFRIFDFFKIYPANKIEKLRGGIGIVGDDLVAGVYTSLILQTAKLFLT